MLLFHIKILFYIIFLNIYFTVITTINRADVPFLDAPGNYSWPRVIIIADKAAIIFIGLSNVSIGTTIA